MKRFLAAAALMAAPAWAMDPTASAPAVACDGWFHMDSIANPLEENTATYAEGEIRITLIFLWDQQEYQLAIMHPPRNELGGRQCSLIAVDEDTGFAEIRFQEREARYDPETGLTIIMPVRVEKGETEDEHWETFYININQQTGEVRYQAFS